MEENITDQFREFSGLDVDIALIRDFGKWENYLFYKLTVVHNNTKFYLTSGVLKMEDMFPGMVKMINKG